MLERRYECESAEALDHREVARGRRDAREILAELDSHPSCRLEREQVDHDQVGC